MSAEIVFLNDDAGYGLRCPAGDEPDWTYGYDRAAAERGVDLHEEECILNAPPQQPDGIDEDSYDYPDPQRAAERVNAFLSEWGDGLIDSANNAHLYARDIASLARAVQQSADVHREEQP